MNAGPWSPAQQRTMAALAWSALEQAVQGDDCADLTAIMDEHPWLAAPAATFVTLEEDGQLRGCIGNLEPSKTLAESLADNAASAALRDPRFAPVTADEIADLTMEISILSPMRPLSVASWQALHDALQPGRDGLLVRMGGRGATFLPAVWDDLPDRTAFLDHLWRKAGLAPRQWYADTRVWTYRADKFAAARP
ncbi:MAG: AmmeMemoRadiSam system protein A [Deltaproteobacteria bacterium]|nr:AmmeMemoRadiSam system protein A [Deltaproteobacteria bacterium]